MEKFSLDLFVTVFVLIVLACHLLQGSDQFRFIALLMWTNPKRPFTPAIYYA